MQFFIDSADIGEIKKALSMGLCDGVTTNPSLVAKTGKKFSEVLKEIEKHPHEHWRVSDEEWRRNRAYDKWVEAIEDMLARTDTAACPWTLVEATDARWTRYRVLSTLVARMEEALRRREEAPAEVSRTHRAQDATREERATREREGLALVRDVAQKAGLPLEAEG